MKDGGDLCGAVLVVRGRYYLHNAVHERDELVRPVAAVAGIAAVAVDGSLARMPNDASVALTGLLCGQLSALAQDWQPDRGLAQYENLFDGKMVLVNR